MLGVFNPPHNFHVTIANEILKNNTDVEKKKRIGIICYIMQYSSVQ